MTDLDLQAIADRYRRALDAKPSKGPITEAGIAAITDSVCDVPELIAEVGRLRRFAGWLEVQPCEVTHEEPFDLSQCETHDLTFPRGGTCAHAGLSEIAYLSDREMGQRVRALRAEARLERIHKLAEHCHRCSCPCHTREDDR